MRQNPEPARRPELLVIGYGNELRGDDAVGVEVARAVERLNVPSVRVIGRHQLTPELADDISRAREVVFVDASVGPERAVALRPLEPAPAGRLTAHAADPRSLLALAREVFGRCPPAWWLTIPIEKTGFGEPLSAVARRGLAEAVQQIKRLAAQSASEPG